MTIKDTISSYLHKGKGSENPSSAAAASLDTNATATTAPVKASDSDTEPVPSTAEEALRRLQDSDQRVQAGSAPIAGQDVLHTSTASTSTLTPPASASVSRNPSQSGLDRYKTAILNKLPVGQFDIGMSRAHDWTTRMTDTFP